MKLKTTASAAIALAVAATRPPVVNAQFIGANFTGSNINQVNVIPPDTMGAVGDNHFVEWINGRYAVYNKSSGSVVTAVSDQQFWSNAGVNLNGADLTDPRILYDHASRRWFASMIDIPAPEGSTTNNFLIAVSNTSDPTAGFKGFKIHSDPANGIFADFPMLGLNANGVYLGSNNFGLTGNQAFQNVDIVSIPKADLLAAVPTVANATVFAQRTALDAGSNKGIGFGPQPVVNFGATASSNPVLGIGRTNALLKSEINRTNILNPGGPGATLSSSTAISATTGIPPLAHQPDGSQVLDANDYRIPSYAYQVGNTIWTAHGISVSSHAAIRWEKIDATTNTVTQAGTISNSSFDYFYPAICPNSNGDVVIGFTRSGSGASDFPSTYAVVGATTGGTITFAAPFLLKQGLGNYHEDFGFGDVRWGDYSATTLDPADPQIFWTNQEWSSQVDTGGSLGKWSTQITEIIVPAAGEFRWKTPANGAFGTGSNWLSGAVPGAGAHTIFSRPTDPAGSGYTVTLGAAVTNDRLSVRQGALTLNLGGFQYTLTDTSSTTTPSVLIGEFASNPQLTITNGTLSSVNATIAPAAAVNGAITVTGGGTWNSSGSVYVGGSSADAAGTGSLTSASGGAVNVAATLKLWSTGTLNLTGGTVSAGSINMAGGAIASSVSTSVASPISINGGTFQPISGTLTLGGTFTNTGTSAITKLGGGPLTIDGTQAHPANAVLTVAAGTLNLNTNAGSSSSPNLSINANATTNFGATQNLKALSIGAATTATLTSGGAKVLATNALTIAGSTDNWTGTLDLTTNDLIIQSTSGGRAAAYANAYNQIKSAINGGGGPWTGNGITSSTAAADSNLLYAVGIISNDDAQLGGAGDPLYATFSGQTADANATLIKSTYFGDANLDGTIDITDYGLIDTAFNNQTVNGGWVNGDFDYSGGTIDISDYGLIDGAFGNQGGVNLTPGLAGVSAVPEPASIAILALAGAALLARNRPRQRRRR